MAEALEIRIANAEDIRRAFNKAPALMVKNLSIAIRKSVLKVQADSMKNTPVRTGRLRASHYSIFEPLKGTVGTDVSADTPGARGADYGVFVHWGTKFMAARPYLADALESNDNNIQGFFKDAVDTTMEEIVRDT